MGFWNASLYGNDLTLDVKDYYIRLLKSGKSIEEADRDIYIKFKDVLESEEASLFWLALADIKWKYGLLEEETKTKALYYINQQVFLKEFILESEQNKWLKTLKKIKVKMLSKEQGKFKIKVEKPFKRNIWNIGDCYAYQFHSKFAEEQGLNGKYIVIQKTGEIHYHDLGNTDASVVRVFKKVFDNIPEVEDLKNLPLLFFVERFTIFDKKDKTLMEKRNVERIISQSNTAELYYERQTHYKEKYFHFIGNFDLEKKYGCGSWINLKEIDEDLVKFYDIWKDYEEEA